MSPAATPSSLSIERWSLRLTLARPLTQVEHAGSMLRGAFGHALKSLACRCGDEQHMPGCPYQQIFDPLPPADWPARYRDCPPAFALTPPAADASSRTRLDFAFTLLGPSHMQRALVWEAWHQAASHGLGNRQIPARLQAIGYDTLLPRLEATRRVRLQLTSPLLLKRKQPGQNTSQPLRPHELGAADLLLALHRRLELTQRLYGVPVQPLPPLAQWLALAERLELRSNLQEHRFTRRSNRQQQHMPLYGLTGTLDLSGPLPPDLLEALSLGQWLHVGGKVSFGMGGYRLFSTHESSVNDGKSMP
ncbi:CRISPR system precrRNA processing endoribonuclease RAMP protein Cas6 [Azotobacter salinestris]|uniref:CRISPR system precrRNA processing endoribonuclease RAMP protein Cas6 n=1 Tax=Azotobacter salinestris TaxID=69964 RepID=UPI0032DF1317